MKEIKIAESLLAKVPELELSCIECDVEIQEKNNDLWNDILDKIKEINSELKVEQISKIPAIQASRKAYKLCGKDPARYRLSAEALLRRVLKRKEIYQVNNVVDLLNLVSISTGFSIGGYDAFKIEGDIEFGIGEKDEPYEGIGRGELNIEFMPVFRDNKGAFGTPTSDSVRTCVSSETKRFLMIIINYGATSLSLATEMAIELLQKYATAQKIEIKNIK
jgi:DNA/RNA-binding domain of Phe-tRNA-synthetase-like protein